MQAAGRTAGKHLGSKHSGSKHSGSKHSGSKRSGRKRSGRKRYDLRGLKFGQRTVLLQPPRRRQPRAQLEIGSALTYSPTPTPTKSQGHGVPTDTDQSCYPTPPLTAPAASNPPWEWLVECSCGRRDWLTTSVIVAALNKGDPTHACRSCAVKRSRAGK